MSEAQRLALGRILSNQGSSAEQEAAARLLFTLENDGALADLLIVIKEQWSRDYRQFWNSDSRYTASESLHSVFRKCMLEAAQPGDDRAGKVRRILVVTSALYELSDFPMRLREIVRISTEIALHLLKDDEMSRQLIFYWYGPPGTYFSGEVLPMFLEVDDDRHMALFEEVLTALRQKGGVWAKGGVDPDFGLPSSSYLEQLMFLENCVTLLRGEPPPRNATVLEKMMAMIVSFIEIPSSRSYAEAHAMKRKCVSAAVTQGLYCAHCHLPLGAPGG